MFSKLNYFLPKHFVASEDESPYELSVCNSYIWEVLGIWLVGRTRCKCPQTGDYLALGTVRPLYMGCPESFRTFKIARHCVDLAERGYCFSLVMSLTNCVAKTALPYLA